MWPVKAPFDPRAYRSILWLLFGAGLAPAAATAAVGIVLLALWPIGGTLALGILVLCFASFALAGTVVTAVLLVRQRRLTRLQDEFVANVSHELRTPLAAIRMFSETLRLGRVRTPAEGEACWTALEQEVDRLSLLVERLLGFRALSRRTGPYTGPPLGLDALLRDALAPTLRHPHDGPRVELEIAPDLPPVAVDARDCAEAVDNLVRNALTHGGPGRVAVRVRVEGPGVAIAVADVGPGIARREQRRIFRRFYRAAHTAGAPSGLGLGLAIVRRFAERARGRVTVQSVPGQGATFTLWLPAAPPAPAPEQRP